ncbi:hypothetical protein SAMN05443574_11135 [Haloarcula vallismortis]|uniref:Uncharacterized protein n=2 Tax=Haloarcula vallismortis TaxID=28442 RepID=A0A1H2Y1M9_HALVA|nr:hypothetical protein [Haloarcula vallismortis]SDW98614.1 hypothetical protein SAMN05443574_11135 [Haloarcula vallismortis]
MTDTRRRFLTTLAGTGTVLALAGCSGTDGDGGGGTDGGMTEGEMTESEMTDGDAMTEGEEMTEESMDGDMSPTDPSEAPMASVDRFSDAAGMLHQRSANDALPDADEPIDFDEMFLTQGYGPDGTVIQYYDFDVQPTQAAPIYALFYENGDPVEDQLNIVDVVPGDEGYNDFWQVHKVTVPDGYEANTATSVSQIQAAGYDIEPTETIKNCPVVPEGSTAELRHSADESATGLVNGWYDGEVVPYFLFGEASLSSSDGSVPLSPIYVSFNTNPGEDGGGPPSGFRSEDGSDQTHNVTATLPGDDGYSPLWQVNIFDNAEFDSVSDLESAQNADILAAGAAMVNCPVVSE